MSVSLENIDNRQLRERLEACLGRKIGPITPTTRKLYIKTLEKYLQKDKDPPKTVRNNLTEVPSSFVTTTTNKTYSTNFRSNIRQEDDHDFISGSKYSYLSDDSLSSADNSIIVDGPLTRPSLPRLRKDVRSTVDNFYGQKVGGDYERPMTSSYTTTNNFIATTKSYEHKEEPSSSSLRRPTTAVLNSREGTNIRNSKISFLLLAAGLFIFIIIAYIYLYKGFSSVTFKDPRDSFIICPKKLQDPDDVCVKKSDLYEMQELMSNIITLVRKYSGEYECGYKANVGLTRDELIYYVGQNSYFRINVVLTILVKNEHWKIRTLKSNNEMTSDIEVIKYISSPEPILPLKCRLGRTVRRFLYIIITFSILVVLMIFTKFAYDAYTKWLESNQNAENELLEKVIDILKEHDELCKSSGDKYNPWLPILYVRDLVIPISERESKSKLWWKVIKKLKSQESKMVFKIDTVKGEDYELMRWQVLPISPNFINGGTTQPKTWQGSAICNGENSVKKLYPPLTNCLKVRNMFNSEVEIGEDWKRIVRDAILEKVGPSHGIVNIVVEGKSKEGCVYIRCLDEKLAGDAFDSLHGWWFDKHLVTVKYLRPQRFLERFPNEPNNTKPLRPSNEARLSLSQPYPRSVLENS